MSSGFSRCAARLVLSNGMDFRCSIDIGKRSIEEILDANELIEDKAAARDMRARIRSDNPLRAGDHVGDFKST